MFFFHDDLKEKRQKDLRRKRSKVKPQEAKRGSMATKKMFEDIDKGEEVQVVKKVGEEDLNLVMPKIENFKFHPDFRLWISTKALYTL